MQTTSMAFYSDATNYLTAVGALVTCRACMVPSRSKRRDVFQWNEAEFNGLYRGCGADRSTRFPAHCSLATVAAIDPPNLRLSLPGSASPKFLSQIPWRSSALGPLDYWPDGHANTGAREAGMAEHHNPLSEAKLSNALHSHARPCDLRGRRGSNPQPPDRRSGSDVEKP